MKKILNIRVVMLAIGIAVAILIAFTLWITPFQEGVSGSVTKRVPNIRLITKNIMFTAFNKLAQEVLAEPSQQN